MRAALCDACTEALAIVGGVGGGGGAAGAEGIRNDIHLPPRLGLAVFCGSGGRTGTGGAAAVDLIRVCLPGTMMTLPAIG